MSQTKTQLVEGLNINTSAPADTLAIDNNGRVGIGTSSPGSPLNVQGADEVEGDAHGTLILEDTAAYNANPIAGVIFRGEHTSGSKAYFSSVYGGKENASDGNYSGYLAFATRVSGSTAAERMRIDSSGRLLVGTTSGSGSGVLIVQGGAGTPTADAVLTLRRGGNNPASGSQGLGQIRFEDLSGGFGAQIEALSDGTWGTTSDCPTALLFKTADDGDSSPTERMRINKQGAVKFTTNGTYASAGNIRHEFTNSAGSQETLYLRHTATSNPYGITINYTGTNPNNAASEFLYFYASGLKFSVRSDGGINNYQSNNNNLSDEREKKNIVNLDSTWDCLKHWELKKFHYNEDPDDADLRYGVIAQQIAPHCPEVISDWVKQRAEDAVLDEDGNVVTPAQEEIVRMGVKEQQMMWMAIKALQEAQSRIETLETANTSQAATIATLDARLAALEGAG